jgi:ribosomal-protein-alanine N-acetyltransferase
MLTINFSPFPILFTERLILRQVSTSDANEILEIRSNKDIMQFINRPLAGSVEDALQYIQKIIDSALANEGITWAIGFKNNATLIGTIGFWKIDKENHRAEIGYILQPQQQQKGIMQEAMVAALDYGFSLMRLHSVVANVNPANEASKKLLEKNNFVKEAYFKEDYFFDGRFLDSAVYSLLTPIK